MKWVGQGNWIWTDNEKALAVIQLRNHGSLHRVVVAGLEGSDYI